MMLMCLEVLSENKPKASFVKDYTKVSSSDSQKGHLYILKQFQAEDKKKRQFMQEMYVATKTLFDLYYNDKIPKEAQNQLN